MPLTLVTFTWVEFGFMPLMALALAFISPASARSTEPGIPRVISASPIAVPASIMPGNTLSPLPSIFSIPAGAEKIDGKGLSVFPGMIDAGTAMGLAEITLGIPGSVDLAEAGDMNANAKAIKGINPNSTHVNVTRVNGITTVMSIPQGGTIAGQSAIINLNGSTPGEMAVVPEFGLVINFPR